MDEKYREGKATPEYRQFQFLSVPISTAIASTPVFCELPEKRLVDRPDLYQEKNEWSFDSCENLLSPGPPFQPKCFS